MTQTLIINNFTPSLEKREFYDKKCLEFQKNKFLPHRNIKTGLVNYNYKLNNHWCATITPKEKLIKKSLL